MKKLQPEEAVEMFKKKGMDVSLEEATQVLELLRKLASIVVENYLEKNMPTKPFNK